MPNTENGYSGHEVEHTTDGFVLKHDGDPVDTFSVLSDATLAAKVRNGLIERAAEEGGLARVDKIVAAINATAESLHDVLDNPVSEPVSEPVAEPVAEEEEVEDEADEPELIDEPAE